MSYIEMFNTRNDEYGDTENIRNINNLKRNIADGFFNSTSYFKVDIYTPTLPKTISPLDCWIVDDKKKNSDLKQIQVMPDQILHYGDIVRWNYDLWIVLQVDNVDGVYYRGSMQLCNSSIRWQDSNGYQQEAFFAIAHESRGLGLEETVLMNKPKDKRYITLQNNIYTNTIRKKQRFIFDNNSCWHVSSMNTLYPNLIHLALLEDDLNVSIDNIGLRICDYNIHDYTLEITDGLSINLVVGSILQMDVVTKDNGIVKSLPVSYTSLDVSIATVSSTGLITCLSTGTVSIIASLTNDSSVNKTMSVVVNKLIAVNGFSLDISGSDFIRFSMSATFIGTVKNNGYVEPKNLVWVLHSDDGIHQTSLASIVQQTVSSVTIKAGNTKGFVKLIGMSIEDNTITSTKRIEIKNLIDF